MPGLAGRAAAPPETRDSRSFSPWEKVRMRASHEEFCPANTGGLSVALNMDYFAGVVGVGNIASIDSTEEIQPQEFKLAAAGVGSPH
jgi:hypothetical protein